MPRLQLVRHGRAAAGWDADADPGLDDVGRQEAEAVAARLGDGPAMSLWASPLRRTLETAAPLARRWGVEPAIEGRVAEIQSPIDDLTERGAWLRDVLQRQWSDLDDELRAWRAQLVECLVTAPDDTVVFTHFVAVNVAVGAATRDDRVVCFAPANGSITTLDTDGTRLHLVTRGDQAATNVN